MSRRHRRSYYLDKSRYNHHRILGSNINTSRQLHYHVHINPYRENSIASLASCEYTDEEMDYTGIEDNDDDDSYARLSSRGSLNDPVERRRRMSRNFLRLTSEGSIGREREMMTTTTTTNNAVFHPLLTNSFEERMRYVSIQGMFNFNSSSSNDHDSNNRTNVAAGDSTIPTFETEVGVAGPSSPPPLPRRVDLCKYLKVYEYMVV